MVFLKKQIKNKKINSFNNDILDLEEFKQLKNIEFEEEGYSSEEVKKILFVRDVFAQNGVIIDDLDVFKNILNGLKLGKNLI